MPIPLLNSQLKHLRFLSLFSNDFYSNDFFPKDIFSKVVQKKASSKWIRLSLLGEGERAKLGKGCPKVRLSQNCMPILNFSELPLTG